MSGTTLGRSDLLSALDQEFGTLIRRSQRGAERMSERIHPELDANAFPLLQHIAQHPSIRPSDLATYFGIGRATTSRQLSRLVELGLVERAIDREDCRSQELSLTEDGKARLRDAQARRHGWYERTLASWSEEDLRTFTDLLTRFARAVEGPRATAD